MTYIMPLSIASVNGTAIDVVNSPVALRRGGASPRKPSCSSSIALLAPMLNYASRAKNQLM